MAIRTILACASGGTASDGAIELGCRLARRFEAHLEGLHVKPDLRDVLMYAGDGFGLALAGDWIEQFGAETAAKAAKIKAAFAAAAARQGLAMAEGPPKVGASAAWREETGYAPLAVSRRARFFDLVVLGRSDRIIDTPHSDTVEETLIQSGRPVLLAPAQVPSGLAIPSPSAGTARPAPSGGWPPRCPCSPRRAPSLSSPSATGTRRAPVT